MNTAAISVREFGRMPADGRPVLEYTLDNGRGLRLCALEYGGIVNQLWVPDAQGRSANVALGFDGLEDYLERNPHFGVIAGRYANRIARSRFMLDGHSYFVDDNDFGNCLHGGRAGFGQQLWQIEPQTVEEGVSLLLSRTSEDGEMGFPGRLQVQVRYTLASADNSWRVDYEARTDRPTVCSLTSHVYFNLAGGGSAIDHELQLLASRYTEVDELGIPLRHESVDGTRYDFRRMRPVADARFDHNWLLDHPLDGSLHPAAHLRCAASGREMTLLTTEPCVQFYAGKWLDGSLRGHGGEVYAQGAGLCLETQHAPDSPNRATGPDWPSTVLRPGEVYRSSTVHRFSAA